MKKTLLALALAFSGASANAEVFDFSNLTYTSDGSAGYVIGEFGGPILPTGTLGSDFYGCTGGDLCSADMDASAAHGGVLTFQSGALTVQASGRNWNNSTTEYDAATVVQDHKDGSGPAGLGVYSMTPPPVNSDDNVTGGGGNFEVLSLFFESDVVFSSLSFYDANHKTIWNSTGAETFEWSDDPDLEDDSWQQLALAGTVAFDLTTERLHLRFGGEAPNEFYLAGMTVTAIPEPETYAMLLAGLGLLGFAARRRKRKLAA